MPAVCNASLRRVSFLSINTPSTLSSLWSLCPSCRVHTSLSQTAGEVFEVEQRTRQTGLVQIGLDTPVESNIRPATPLTGPRGLGQTVLSTGS